MKESLFYMSELIDINKISPRNKNCS